MQVKNHIDHEDQLPMVVNKEIPALYRAGSAPRRRWLRLRRVKGEQAVRGERSFLASNCRAAAACRDSTQDGSNQKKGARQ